MHKQYIDSEQVKQFSEIIAKGPLNSMGVISDITRNDMSTTMVS